MTRIGQVKSIVREDGGNFVVVKWASEGHLRVLINTKGLVPKVGAFYAIENDPQHPLTWRLARRVLAPCQHST